MKQKVLHWYYQLLAVFARGYLRRHKPIIVGVSGSIGKTSCRMIVYQTLKKFLPDVRIYSSPKNFNGELGLSLSILQVSSFVPRVSDFLYVLFRGLDLRLFGPKRYDVIVLEYGVDRPGEMDFLLSIVQPNIGVFTAADAVHSEQFGNPDVIASEDAKMVLASKEMVFLNIDDMYSAQMVDRLTVDVFHYHTLVGKDSADISFRDELYIQENNDIYATFVLSIKGQDIAIQTNLLGNANYGYIGVGLVIADVLQYKLRGSSLLEQAEGFVLDYELQPGRMNIFSGFKDSVLLDSSYNASPMSVKKIINTAYTIKQQLFPAYKMLLVLGDMRELGDFTEQLHRDLAGYVLGAADRVFLLGSYMQEYLLDELEKIGYDMTQVSHHRSSEELGDQLRELLTDSADKYILVFKGSQNTIFLEEAIKKVLDRPEDIQKLPRQSTWWLEQKEKFFTKLR